MQIEVLNGEDGKTVVRGVDPSKDGEEFAGCVVDPGEKVTITLPEVHEAEGVEFGEKEQIEETPA